MATCGASDHAARRTTALCYLLFAMAIKVDIGHLGLGDVGQVLLAVTAGILNIQIALPWGFLLLFGFYGDRASPAR